MGFNENYLQKTQQNPFVKSITTTELRANVYLDRLYVFCYDILRNTGMLT
jgi:hypothetical protein